ncbi:MAG: hypothetical protein PVG99_02490 [Desulfobacteraceae bacterium]|jgi:hypothetical protein
MLLMGGGILFMRYPLSKKVMASLGGQRDGGMRRINVKIFAYEDG